MDRVRGAGQAVLLLLVLASLALVGPTSSAARPPAELAAAVAWPTSSLVVSEVQTGGASASDEFAEISNAGAVAVDLTGLEVVYATSTGSTVTRKASWTAATILEPGRHLLIANSAGVFALIADATYSGGFAATGGAIVLRPIGGTPIDAVGWGDATNAFVEGSVASAPPAGSSIERLPGGELGNGTDTNENSLDFAVRASPTPQNLAASPTPPTPAPTPTPTPTPTPMPTRTHADLDADPDADPDTHADPDPDADGHADVIAYTHADSDPTPTPTPSADADPDADADANRHADADSVTHADADADADADSVTHAHADPDTDPTPTPTPILSIADARALPDGAIGHDPRDAHDGARRDRIGADRLRPGRDRWDRDPPRRRARVAARGRNGRRGDRRALELLQPACLRDDRVGHRRRWARAAAGSARGDDRRGRRGVRGHAAGRIGHGDGRPGRSERRARRHDRRRERAAPARCRRCRTGRRERRDRRRRHRDRAARPARQQRHGPRRLPAPRHVGRGVRRDARADAHAQPDTIADRRRRARLRRPTPAPTTSPLPSATPTPAPSATPTPTASPSPAPSADPGRSIADARRAPVGSLVTVTGVVIAEAGRLGTPPLLAIADATAGIAVHLPDDTAAPPRGTRVQVTGKLADPYGQLEIRPSSSGFRVVGSGRASCAAGHRRVDARRVDRGQPRPRRRDRERQADEGVERRHHVLPGGCRRSRPDRRRRLERPHGDLGRGRRQRTT